MASVQANEYELFMALREQIKQGIESAESEFMLTTYTRLNAIMNKRQSAANNLNVVLDNKATREAAQKKRDELKASREK
jgi:hypothetical protein